MLLLKFLGAWFDLNKIRFQVKYVSESISVLFSPNTNPDRCKCYCLKTSESYIYCYQGFHFASKISLIFQLVRTCRSCDYAHPKRKKLEKIISSLSSKYLIFIQSYLVCSLKWKIEKYWKKPKPKTKPPLYSRRISGVFLFVYSVYFCFGSKFNFWKKRHSFFVFANSFLFDFTIRKPLWRTKEIMNMTQVLAKMQILQITTVISLL